MIVLFVEGLLGRESGERERERESARARACVCICVYHDDMYMCVRVFVRARVKHPKSISLYRREQRQQWKSYNHSSTSPLSRWGNTHAHLLQRKMIRIR
jgi:hypothetical protein